MSLGFRVQSLSTSSKLGQTPIYPPARNRAYTTGTFQTKLIKVIQQNISTDVCVPAAI